jgi:type IV pilus assembly protein PilA
MYRVATSLTALEIMIVMGVIGILSAVALPAYRDYTLRTRVAELIGAAAACKSAVGEFYLMKGRLPLSAREAGCSDRVTANANPLAVFNGEVMVQAVGSLASQLGRHKLIAFRAVFSDGACAGAPIEAWVCSPSGKPGSSTTILPKYLPTSCR